MKKEHKWQVKYLIGINDEIISCQKKETAKLIAETFKTIFITEVF